MKKIILLSALILTAAGAFAAKTRLGSTDTYYERTGTAPNYTITISGTGDMPSFIYTDSPPLPWESYRDKITTVVIQNGVTNIGDGAFYNCTALTSVSIPSTDTVIGDVAFTNCNLSAIVIPENVTKIGRQAFRGCRNLTTIISFAIIPPILGTDFSVFETSAWDNATVYAPLPSVGVSGYWHGGDIENDFYGWWRFMNVRQISNATHSSDGTVISWVAINNITGYRLVFYTDEIRTDVTRIVEFDANGQKISDTPLRAADIGTPFSYPITGLDGNTKYFYTLEYLGAGNAPLFSTDSEFTTLASAGINDTPAPDTATIANYYTLLGQKLPAAPESGVYIILYENGTAKKVMK